MKILGIDPGTKCGWAVLQDGTVVASGVWDLSAKRHEGGGMRFVRLRCYLEEVAGLGIDAVGYEEVRSHSRRDEKTGRMVFGVDAAHVYGGIVATLAAWCESRTPVLPYRAVPVGTIKKLATGKGNAKKSLMVTAAVSRFGCKPKDDNEADALFIALALGDELRWSATHTQVSALAGGDF